MGSSLSSLGLDNKNNESGKEGESSSTAANEEDDLEELNKFPAGEVFFDGSRLAKGNLTHGINWIKLDSASEAVSIAESLHDILLDNMDIDVTIFLPYNKNFTALKPDELQQINKLAMARLYSAKLFAFGLLLVRPQLFVSSDNALFTFKRGTKPVAMGEKMNILVYIASNAKEWVAKRDTLRYCDCCYQLDTQTLVCDTPNADSHVITSNPGVVTIRESGKNLTAATFVRNMLPTSFSLSKQNNLLASDFFVVFIQYAAKEYSDAIKMCNSLKKLKSATSALVVILLDAALPIHRKRYALASMQLNNLANGENVKQIEMNKRYILVNQSSVSGRSQKNNVNLSWLSIVLSVGPDSVSNSDIHGHFNTSNGAFTVINELKIKNLGNIHMYSSKPDDRTIQVYDGSPPNIQLSQLATENHDIIVTIVTESNPETDWLTAQVINKMDSYDKTLVWIVKLANTKISHLLQIIPNPSRVKIVETIPGYTIFMPSMDRNRHEITIVSGTNDTYGTGAILQLMSGEQFTPFQLGIFTQTSKQKRLQLPPGKPNRAVIIIESGGVSDNLVKHGRYFLCRTKNDTYLPCPLLNVTTKAVTLYYARNYIMDRLLNMRAPQDPTIGVGKYNPSQHLMLFCRNPDSTLLSMLRELPCRGFLVWVRSVGDDTDKERHDCVRQLVDMTTKAPVSMEIVCDILPRPADDPAEGDTPKVALDIVETDEKAANTIRFRSDKSENSIALMVYYSTTVPILSLQGKIALSQYDNIVIPLLPSAAVSAGTPMSEDVMYTQSEYFIMNNSASGCTYIDNRVMKINQNRDIFMFNLDYSKSGVILTNTYQKLFDTNTPKTFISFMRNVTTQRLKSASTTFVDYISSRGFSHLVIFILSLPPEALAVSESELRNLNATFERNHCTIRYVPLVSTSARVTQQYGGYYMVHPILPEDDELVASVNVEGDLTCEITINNIPFVYRVTDMVSEATEISDTHFIVSRKLPESFATLGHEAIYTRMDARCEYHPAVEMFNPELDASNMNINHTTTCAFARLGRSFVITGKHFNFEARSNKHIILLCEPVANYEIPVIVEMLKDWKPEKNARQQDKTQPLTILFTMRYDRIIHITRIRNEFSNLLLSETGGNQSWRLFTELLDDDALYVVSNSVENVTPGQIGILSPRMPISLRPQPMLHRLPSSLRSLVVLKHHPRPRNNHEAIMPRDTAINFDMRSTYASIFDHRGNASPFTIYYNEMPTQLTRKIRGDFARIDTSGEYPVFVPSDVGDYSGGAIEHIHIYDASVEDVSTLVTLLGRSTGDISLLGKIFIVISRNPPPSAFTDLQNRLDNFYYNSVKILHNDKSVTYRTIFMMTGYLKIREQNQVYYVYSSAAGSTTGRYQLLSHIGASKHGSADTYTSELTHRQYNFNFEKTLINSCIHVAQPVLRVHDPKNIPHQATVSKCDRIIFYGNDFDNLTNRKKNILWIVTWDAKHRPPINLLWKTIFDKQYPATRLLVLCRQKNAAAAVPTKIDVNSVLKKYKWDNYNYIANNTNTTGLAEYPHAVIVTHAEDPGGIALNTDNTVNSVGATIPQLRVIWPETNRTPFSIITSAKFTATEALPDTGTIMRISDSVSQTDGVNLLTKNNSKDTTFNHKVNKIAALEFTARAIELTWTISKSENKTPVPDGSQSPTP